MNPRLLLLLALISAVAMIGKTQAATRIALAGAGNRAAALAAYQRCEQILHDDLNIAPDDATVALAAMIRAGTTPAPNTPAHPGQAPQAPDPASSGVASTPPPAHPLHRVRTGAATAPQGRMPALRRSSDVLRVAGRHPECRPR